MAKGFGAPTMQTTANGSLGGVRPMPRPMGLGGVEIAASRPQQGFLAQHLGPQGSDTRYEMAMQMLQAAISSASGSNNPLLAFLAPIIGSVTGAKVQQQRDGYISAEQDAMTQSLLGGNLNPQAQQALEVLNNPNAPDHLKSIAATMFKQNAVPVGQLAAPARRNRSGGAGRSSGGGGASGPGRLVGEYVIDGVIHGRDRNGNLHPYKTPDGRLAGTGPVDRPVTSPAAATPAMPSLPPDPVLPSDPGMPSNDDELIKKYLGQ